MDTWLLLCMGFVALALFEYAVLLTIRFGKQGGNSIAFLQIMLSIFI